MGLLRQLNVDIYFQVYRLYIAIRPTHSIALKVDFGEDQEKSIEWEEDEKKERMNIDLAQ